MLTVPHTHHPIMIAAPASTLSKQMLLRALADAPQQDYSTACLGHQRRTIQSSGSRTKSAAPHAWSRMIHIAASSYALTALHCAIGPFLFACIWHYVCRVIASKLETLGYFYPNSKPENVEQCPCRTLKSLILNDKNHQALKLIERMPIRDIRSHRNSVCSLWDNDSTNSSKDDNRNDKTREPPGSQQRHTMHAKMSYTILYYIILYYIILYYIILYYIIF